MTQSVSMAKIARLEVISLAAPKLCRMDGRPASHRQIAAKPKANEISAPFFH